MQETLFNSWVRKIPWRRDRLPTPVFLGFLVARLVKNLPAIQETWVRSLSWEDPLEKGKATHSSILAWRIPWTVACQASLSAHALLQARILEWVAYPFSRDLPSPGIEPRSPALQGDSLPAELPGKPNLPQGQQETRD